MRMQFVAPFVLLGLLSFCRVEAQTWEQPDVLWWNDNVSGNTCGAPNTIEVFDGFYAGGSPDVVYDLPVWLKLRGWTQGPEFLTLSPYYWQQPVDFEVFVCEYKNGYVVSDCALEADNMYNTGNPVLLVIPPEYQAFRIIVTSGLLNQNYDWGGCGAYTLDTHH